MSASLVVNAASKRSLNTSEQKKLNTYVKQYISDYRNGKTISYKSGKKTIHFNKGSSSKTSSKNNLSSISYTKYITYQTSYSENNLKLIAKKIVYKLSIKNKKELLNTNYKNSGTITTFKNVTDKKLIKGKTHSIKKVKITTKLKCSSKGKSPKVSLSKTSYLYDGKSKKPKVTLKTSSGKKISSKYYSISYQNNTNAGKGTVVIKMKTPYSGTLKKTFIIKPDKISNHYSVKSLSVSSYVYDGKAKKPQITITLKSGSKAKLNASVTYANNVKVGTATVIIKDKDKNLTGSLKKNYKIKKAANNTSAVNTFNSSTNTYYVKKSYTAKQINEILAIAKKSSKKITVKFEKGTYVIDKKLTVYSNTSIIIPKGTIIKIKSSGIVLNGYYDKKSRGYSGIHNVSIDGGTWYGHIRFVHGQNIVLSNMIIDADNGKKAKKHILTFAGCKNVYVTSCTFRNGPSYTLIDKITRNHAEALHLDVCRKANESLSKPYDLTWCRDIYVKKCTFSNVQSGIGTHASKSISGHGSNWVMIGNYFKSMPYDCYHITKVVSVYISNNTYSKCKNFVKQKASSNVTVTGNKQKK